MTSGYCRRMPAQLPALEFAESVTDRFARVDYAYGNNTYGNNTCGNSACGDRPYPHHRFDLPEDIASFPYPDLSALRCATTQLAKGWVGVSLRSDTLHVKPHPLNHPTDRDRPVCAPAHLIQ
jgi:hypothetical protein